MFERDKGKRISKAKVAMVETNCIPATEAEVTAFKRLLNEMVVRCSAWMVEASRYTHFLLYQFLANGSDEEITNEFNKTRAINYFLSQFKQLQDVPPMPLRGKLDENYTSIRRETGYSRNLNGNIMLYAAQLFKTNFENNVRMHAHKHVKRFLRHKFPGKKHKQFIHPTVEYMFWDKCYFLLFSFGDSLAF